MSKYENAKIYKLVNKVTNEIYIGSTVCDLKKRFSEHRANYKRYIQGKGNYSSAYKLFENGTEDVSIELIEAILCQTREEMVQREKYHFKNNVCVNKNHPVRTKAEYYNDKKPELLAKQREYYSKTADKKREYYLKNKERIQARYQQNKESILAESKLRYGICKQIRKLYYPFLKAARQEFKLEQKRERCLEKLAKDLGQLSVE